MRMGAWVCMKAIYVPQTCKAGMTSWPYFITNLNRLIPRDGLMDYRFQLQTAFMTGCEVGCILMVCCLKVPTVNCGLGYPKFACTACLCKVIGGLHASVVTAMIASQPMRLRNQA